MYLLGRFSDAVVVGKFKAFRSGAVSSLLKSPQKHANSGKSRLANPVTFTLEVIFFSTGGGGRKIKKGKVKKKTFGMGINTQLASKQTKKKKV